jgi:two-component system cell cycle response regulator
MNIALINSNQSFNNAVTTSLKGYKSKIIASAGIDNALVDIQKHSINTAIINWSRGDFDINSLCKRIRKIKLNRYVYLIVVTARDREGAIARFLDAGANDFLFKPFGKGEMIARMKIAEWTIKREEEIIRHKKKILKMVKEDPITGLLNRRSLLDEMLREMGRAAREMKYISVVMTSITNFKELADAHGMPLMEEVLSECGRRMKSSCRPYDKLGRYTVSDFLLFLPDSGTKNTEKVAGRIIHSLVKKPIIIKNIDVKLALSIGVSDLDPKQIAQNNSVDSNLLNDLILDSLIKRAETAVKRALRLGKNKIEVFRE